jgi:hypothetical protein
MNGHCSWAMIVAGGSCPQRPGRSETPGAAEYSSVTKRAGAPTSFQLLSAITRGQTGPVISNRLRETARP